MRGASGVKAELRQQGSTGYDPDYDRNISWSIGAPLRPPGACLPGAGLNRGGCGGGARLPVGASSGVMRGASGPSVPGGGRNRPSGPNLPRQRITDGKMSGRVLEWKGKYGWISPSVRFDHPRAKRHNGRIFVSVVDLVDINRLAPGDTVYFHLFEDDAGLGAEECSMDPNSDSPRAVGDGGCGACTTDGNGVSGDAGGIGAISSDVRAASTSAMFPNSAFTSPSAFGHTAPSIADAVNFSDTRNMNSGDGSAPPRAVGGGGGGGRGGRNGGGGSGGRRGGGTSGGGGVVGGDCNGNCGGGAGGGGPLGAGGVGGCPGGYGGCGGFGGGFGGVGFGGGCGGACGGGYRGGNGFPWGGVVNGGGCGGGCNGAIDGCPSGCGGCGGCWGGVGGYCGGCCGGSCNGCCGGGCRANGGSSSGAGNASVAAATQMQFPPPHPGAMVANFGGVAPPPILQAFGVMMPRAPFDSPFPFMCG
eukprot:TRINITY_DN23149_c0_g1_i1.p1 TRINITY_DN23149_c0_g1~~TRINITY_DN23149_c0_g1_i1.p1  ORF type:complete len:474 (+),score=104.65 TRINITY_DN23149_c0_g1_i1:347-1768(+)